MAVDPLQASSEEPGKPIVICVDDDRNNLNALGRVLRARCNVLLATGGEEALEFVEQHPDVAWRCSPTCACPGCRAPSCSPACRTLRPHCRRAVVTGFPESDELIAAINAGHLHYVITKPWKLPICCRSSTSSSTRYRLERDNARLRRRAAARSNHSCASTRSYSRRSSSRRGREISAATEQLAQMGLQLDALTLRDALTGLYTHRAFQERLREEVARALRYGQPMSLLICRCRQLRERQLRPRLPGRRRDPAPDRGGRSRRTTRRIACGPPTSSRATPARSSCCCCPRPRRPAR